jgi:hypothetical protein
VTTAELTGNGALKVKDLPGHQLLLVGFAAPASPELDRAAKALPEWVEGGLPDAVVDYGMARRETKHFTPGDTPGVSGEDPAIQVGMWQLPDRIMLTVYKSEGKANKTHEVKVDLAALGLVPELQWQEFVRVRNLLGKEQVQLDYYNNKLVVTGLAPKSGALVGIRRY